VVHTGVAPATQRRRTSWDIAPVTRGDIAELAQLFLKLHLYNASFDPRFALAEDWERHFAAMVESAITGKDHLVLLARDDGRPVGFVLAAVHHDSPIWQHNEWVEVEALYVEHSWRGAGLADDLLSCACAWANDLGLPAVQLYVTASNTRAISFYERQEFRPVQSIMRALLPAEQAERPAPDARLRYQGESRR